MSLEIDFDYDSEWETESRSSSDPAVPHCQTMARISSIFSSQYRSLVENIRKSTNLEIEEVSNRGDCQFDAIAHQLVRMEIPAFVEVFLRYFMSSWVMGLIPSPAAGSSIMRK